MKKLMLGSVFAMAAGAGMFVCALNSKKTGKSTAKLVNNAMNMANDKLNSMK